eukprot:TRINITY_DN2141_c0_g1_i3.p1 TRINITY_DN2141_c0_g1~~TRINITY_DN2141_c0_g1_i3.p1  ORF type:complete len:223 (-),score=35.77 TRINITY_DN2141_c0_g1_i3:61-672(-)
MTDASGLLAPFLWRSVMYYVSTEKLSGLFNVHSTFRDVVSESCYKRLFLAREEDYAVVKSPSKTNFLEISVQDHHFWKNAFNSKEEFATLEEALRWVDTDDPTSTKSRRISETQEYSKTYYAIFVRPKPYQIHSKLEIELDRTGLSIEVVGEGKVDHNEACCSGFYSKNFVILLFLKTVTLIDVLNNKKKKKKCSKKRNICSE